MDQLSLLVGLLKKNKEESYRNIMEQGLILFMGNHNVNLMKCYLRRDW